MGSENGMESSGMELLSDKQRCDAWELGIQVATLQARGVREFHILLERMKEQLSKEIWLSSQSLNSYKEETTSKIMQVRSNTMACLCAGSQLASHTHHCRCGRFVRRYPCLGPALHSVGDGTPWDVAPPTHSREGWPHNHPWGVCVRMFGAWWGLETFKMLSQTGNQHQIIR
jgi:hypothetical protein